MFIYYYLKIYQEYDYIYMYYIEKCITVVIYLLFFTLKNFKSLKKNMQNLQNCNPVKKIKIFFFIKNYFLNFIFFKQSF